MSDLKIVFAGTPEFSATSLMALIKAEFHIEAVYTQPDRQAGRGKKLQASPVKTTAIDYNIPVYQPLNFKDLADVATLAALEPDLMIVVAYGLLLPQSVLDIPKYGCINVHASLLPRWRGAAPIERAIAAGDAMTGITIMQMDIGLDTGDMLNRRQVAIHAETTGDSLRQQLAESGNEALIETLQQIKNNNLQPEKQDNTQANYAHKLQKEEAEINWREPAPEIDRKIRAFNSSNVCYTHFADERIKLWQAIPLAETSNKTPGTIIEVNKKHIVVACGEGCLQLLQLQLPNAKKMDVAAIINGKQGMFVAGKAFG